MFGLHFGSGVEGDRLGTSYPAHDASDLKRGSLVLRIIMMRSVTQLGI